jgi:cysteinyl-tRNA synthetase
MFMDVIKFIKGLIELMKSLIARKIAFEVNLSFNWKKLKFWGQIIIFES